MRQGARGFVLVLVLAMLVILSLLAGSVALVTSRLRDQAQARQQQMQDAIDIASTQATLLYLLSTQRMTFAGLTVDRLQSVGPGEVSEVAAGEMALNEWPVGNEIALDGRSYAGIGAIRFALQDDRGLLGVNWMSPTYLQRLLGQSGTPLPEPADVLVNRLMDYQDTDDLYRLNSAEADGYRKAGLAPPTNRPLVTPMELHRVMGWDRALAVLDPAEVNGLLSVEVTGLININTAPKRVLRTLTGIDDEIAERIIAYRKLQPFLSESTFFELAGRPMIAEDPIAVYPATSGTLQLWSSHGGRVALVHWTLTPVDDGGRPWREDYELIQFQDRPVDDVALPVRSRLFAKPVAAPN